MLYPYDPIHVMACVRGTMIGPHKIFNFRLMPENPTMKLKKFLNKNLVLVFSVQ